MIFYKSSWKQNWVHQLITQREKLSINEKKHINAELLKIKKITYYFIIEEKIIEIKNFLKKFLKDKIKKILFIK